MNKTTYHLTYLKHITRWYLVHSQCWVIISAIQFQNVFITPEGNSYPICSPPIPPPQPLVGINCSVPKAVPALDVLYKWNRVTPAFRGWRLSLGVASSRRAPGAAGVRAPHPLGRSERPSADGPRLCTHSSVDGRGLAPPVGSSKQNMLVQVCV